MDESWRTHTINVDHDALPLLEREWLITNGAGSYAMGTVPGVNTRRYHGLLVAATHPPVGRIVTVSQMLETLRLHGAAGPGAEFTSLLFQSPHGEVYSPTGFAMLRRFEKGLSVRWQYAWEGVSFSRELSLPWKGQGASLHYKVSGLPSAGTLRLSPMITLRDFHGMIHRSYGEPVVEAEPGLDVARFRRGEHWAFTMACAGSRWRHAEHEPWWHGVYYPQEAERGQESLEDYYVPGGFEIEIGAGRSVDIHVTIALGEEALSPSKTDGTRTKHLQPMADHLKYTEGVSHATPKMLAIAADDFLVDRVIREHDVSTILAGYPWFADWGRDTFIALPGLLLATGRTHEAGATLFTFAGAIRNGLVPNRFDDYDDRVAHYNTVDGSLWFIHAALAFVRETGDKAAWHNWLGTACRQIIDAYMQGADGPIWMDEDGLIAAGNSDTQLTWMDAKQGGVVFTPRHGKAVEINALWHSALAQLAVALADDEPGIAKHYGEVAQRVREHFTDTFWDDELGYLRDHLWQHENGGWHPDRTLRPNQVLAVSLPESPLDDAKQRGVVDVVRDRLLTPAGLRTLPEDDPSYHPFYRGDMFERDEAYHQGTIWPWLIGPYAEAVLRVGKFGSAARAEALQVVRPLLEEIAHGGLGQLHEIHEAHRPHRPVGCIAQAWSVAEVIRVLRLIRT